jgi:hypothetical protein
MKNATNYDYKQAKNKNLDASARLHYLENARHNVDSRAAVKMMGKSPAKLESAAQEKKDLMMDMPIDKRAAAKMAKSPMEMAGENSAMKMAGESPMKMGGSWMSKHSGLKMMKPSPAKLYKKK